MGNSGSGHCCVAGSRNERPDWSPATDRNQGHPEALTGHRRSIPRGESSRHAWNEKRLLGGFSADGHMGGMRRGSALVTRVRGSKHQQTAAPSYMAPSAAVAELFDYAGSVRPPDPSSGVVGSGAAVIRFGRCVSGPQGRSSFGMRTLRAAPTTGTLGQHTCRGPAGGIGSFSGLGGRSGRDAEVTLGRGLDPASVAQVRRPRPDSAARGS